MSEPSVTAAGVWKRFRRGQLHDSLRDLLPALGRRLVGRQSPAAAPQRGEFWALRDVSFRVGPGDALGVIGPNGAGKSTLLKVLTGVLRPTAGECQVSGRVGALIEIAAGFHPDLTGRENVFLQGAIMGMNRSEIARRFDDIVDFSGIAPFIDTPVKRYSSGMNARLGFSIAAHLEPDVLIIDEVLAVGDLTFQEQAFGRIAAVARQGVPVVVVSHQMERVGALCNRAILLNAGLVVRQGSPSECISAYVLGSAAAPAAAVESACSIAIEQLSLESPRAVRSGEEVRLRLRGSTRPTPDQDVETLEIRVRALHTGQLVYATSLQRAGLALPAAGRFELGVRLDMNLPVGLYALETVVYQVRRQAVVGQGPYATVQVLEGRSFWGSVQLNADLELAVSAERPAALRA